MFNKYLSLSFMVLMFFAITACAEPTNNNGKEVTNATQSGEGLFPEIEGDYLVEFFWLGCSHCQEVDPYVEKYNESNPDVQLVRVPATFNDRWVLDAKVHYAAEEVGVDFVELIGFYEDVRLRQNRLPTYKEIVDFVNTQVPTNDFEVVVQSPEVAEKVAKADEMVKEMSIEGTPTFVVNGKDVVTTEDVNSYEGIVQKAYSSFK